VSNERTQVSLCDRFSGLFEGFLGKERAFSAVNYESEMIDFNVE